MIATSAAPLQEVMATRSTRRSNFFDSCTSVSVLVCVAGTRTKILSSAMKWVDEKVPYCQCNADCCGTCKYCHEGDELPWRCDCSGFVSHAWGLPGGLNTHTLHCVARLITKDELKPGDVLLYPEEHVMFFDGWTNDAHTAFHAIQEPGCHAAPLPPHATRNEESWPVWGGDDFYPFRFKYVVDA